MSCLAGCKPKRDVRRARDDAGPHRFCWGTMGHHGAPWGEPGEPGTMGHHGARPGTMFLS